MKNFLSTLFAVGLLVALNLSAQAGTDDCGTALATDDCDRASIGVQNLVRNSSFEVGTEGWSLLRGEYLKSISNPSAPLTPAYTAPSIDISSANHTHGDGSLMITNANRGSWRLMSREFQVEPGQQYVLSFDSKASVGGEYMNVRIAFADGEFEQHAQWFHPDMAWQRFQLPPFTVPNGRRHVNIEIEYNIYSRSANAATIWLDGFQVRKTPDTAYTARPQEVGVTGSGIPWTTSKSQDVGVTFQLRNNTAATVSDRVHYAVVDEYYQKVVSQGDTPIVSVGANASVQQTVTNVSPKKRGKFILSYQLVDSNTGIIFDRGQYDFIVIDSVQKGPNQFTDAFSVSDTVTQQGGRPMGIDGESTDIYTLYNCSPGTFFDLRAAAGDRWLRSWDFQWCNIEPVDNQFNWSLTDYVVNEAAARGMRVMPCLGVEFILDENFDLPQWLRNAGSTTKSRWPSGDGTVVLPPQPQWTAYVTAIVNRYKDRINTWEILNEPQMWIQSSEYLPYLQSAYTAIKAADPNARVVGFTASQDYGSNPFQYLQECFDNQGLNYADVVDFHPYTARLDWSEPTTQDSFNAGLRNFVNAKGGTGKPIWCGELYYLTKPGKDERYLAQKMKGHELARRYLVDLGTGVERSFAFEDVNYNKIFLPTSTTQLGFRTGGLSPSVYVPIYNTLTKLFEGAKPEAEVNVGGKTKLYHFTKSGDAPVGAVWSFDDNNARSSLTIPNAADKIQLWDIMGNNLDQPTSGNLTLTFNNSPIYLTPKTGVPPATFRSLLNALGSGVSYLPIYPANSGFEFPYTPSFAYTPAATATAAGWTFTGQAGVQRNNGGFTGAPSAPQGTQTGFLQNQGSMSQSVTFTVPGTYTLTYKAAQRAQYQSGPQSIRLSIGGVVKETWTPPGNSFSTHSYSFPVTAAGSKTFLLAGTAPSSGDSTAFLDDVVFTH